MTHPHREFNHDPVPLGKTPWVKKGSKRRLWKGKDLIAAIVYVEYEQGEPSLRHDARMGTGSDYPMLSLPQIDPVATAPRF